MADKVIIGLGLAVATLFGGLLTSVILEENRTATMNDALSGHFNEASFRLEGAHAVTATYEGRNYTFNFDNSTVLGGQTRGVGFGGAGYGGMVSFDHFEDKTAIATARAQGCAIAAHMAQAANPGWPVTGKFEDARRKAATFTVAHCQP